MNAELLEILAVARADELALELPGPAAASVRLARGREGATGRGLPARRRDLLAGFERWRVARVDVRMRDALDLAFTHDLTISDASYLHLAIARKLPLVTLDADLRRAAGNRARP